jgi:2-succinyl-5-enolpyruvyl-6-hydroxy-3-cyclohexene-1-carboxylate synthase
MIHPKQHIVDLAEICWRKGVENVIISPGSRNAPLIDAFHSCFKIKCISIVDERSAGYFAIGIARYTQSPVVLICTSGTAILNYSPALAEAYYQQVPLIAITADRPAEWIDQLDNQTIRQQGVYRNFIKNSYQLPQTISSEDTHWHAQRLINEAVNSCTRFPLGPVHINVPLAEPLYDKLPDLSQKIRTVDLSLAETCISLPQQFVKQWQLAKKILIVCGQDIPESEVSDPLAILSKDPRVVIIAENISNLKIDNVIHNPDLLFSHNNESSIEYPDLLIYSGGPIVSKKLKTYLRKADEILNWRIGYEDQIVDTFQHVTDIVSCSPKEVYNALGLIEIQEKNSDYQMKWLHASESALKRRDEIGSDIPFSDFKVFDLIMNTLPENSIVELGNSSVIRYSQFFSVNRNIKYYSNRGISGIDGCLSTAAGTAYASKILTIAIVGDLSFVYDSNALWNRELPVNLKIIVINNAGGGIFHLIDGPSDKPGFKKYIEAYHPVNIHKLAEAFDLEYFYADNEKELSEKLPLFFSDSKKAAILEIKTEAKINSEVFHRMMGHNILTVNPE